MIKSRKALLDWLKNERAYNGKDDLESIKSFLKESNIEVEGEDGKPFDLDAAWKEWSKPTRLKFGAVSDPSDHDDDQNDGARRVTKVNAGMTAIADRKGAGWNHDSVQKKRYEAKAARGETAFEDVDKAEAFCAWARQATVMHCEDYQKSGQNQKDREILKKTGLTTNAAGQTTIPEDFSADLIVLKEDYKGVNAMVDNVTMSRDTQTFPRLTDDLTVYAPGEGTAITASDLAFDGVTLTATKLAVLSNVSSELLHDSAIRYADVMAQRIAYAFAKKEAQCLLLGDGTSTYFGFIGMTYKFRKVLEDAGGTWTTDAHRDNLAGMVTAAGNTYDEITLADLEELVGKFPQFDFPTSPSWIVSRPFWSLVMLRLALVGSGVTSTEIVNGVRQDYFLGYPVKFNPAMPKVAAGSQVCALFGDYKMGAKLGTVRGSMSVAQSDQRYWDQDLISFRGLERVAITVHDVGDYNATAASRNAGPICALSTLNA